MPRLEIDVHGRLTCASNPALITWNHPFPTVNGRMGFSEPANGVVIHTEVGYEHSVEQEFNNPNDQASAFVSIGIDGHIHQYGPLGKGWLAWTQAAGNHKWRGAENEDLGNPKHPLTTAQIESLASFIEVCSRLDKFPIASTDDVNGKGVIFHVDGGAAWGGHSCPGPVRQAQRPDVIKRAIALRSNQPGPVIATPTTPVEHFQHAMHLTMTNHWDIALDNRLESVRTHAHNALEQQACGVAADGKWGAISARGEHTTIQRIQWTLHVMQDGVWGTSTEKAFQAMRTKYRGH